MSKTTYTVNLTLSGYEARTRSYYGFTRIVAEARTRQQAEKEYDTFLAGHHFKPSENYGIFLSIRKDQSVIFCQQIN